MGDVERAELRVTSATAPLVENIFYLFPTYAGLRGLSWSVHLPFKGAVDGKLSANVKGSLLVGYSC
jgi:hypothetical protein